LNREGRYLVVTADDLGRSSSVNLAIAEAHDRGIVTAASIMAGGGAFDEAVQIVLNRRGLSVGLHVTLCDGRPVLQPSLIPALVDPSGSLLESPVKAWLSFMGRGVLSQIEAEVEAQFARLEQAGIKPTHVDCHHHLHMNPPIFEVVCRHASRRGIRWIRLPNESFSLVLHSRFSSRGLMPFAEWAVFGTLRAYNHKIARKYGINAACNSLGLSRTESIDEKYLLYILNRARSSINEIFTHPDISTVSGRNELDALISTDVRSRIGQLGIDLIGYKGLPGEDVALNSVPERI
jgi:hopanoid biosynthesis associated protein HpnK